MHAPYDCELFQEKKKKKKTDSECLKFQLKSKVVNKCNCIIGAKTSVTWGPSAQQL
jgi:hypothetical protein